jgi:hypothetical protein
MNFTYRGCKVSIKEWSGFYQARVVFSDGTSRTTGLLFSASFAMRAAENLIDEWHATL